jgi:hypothetical protein
VITLQLLSSMSPPTDPLAWASVRSSRNESERALARQLVLWEIVTHEVAALQPPKRLAPISRAERARDEQFMRELGAMVAAARSDETCVLPALPKAPRKASHDDGFDPMAVQQMIDFVRNLRQVSDGDRDIVALLAAYERGLDGKRAAAKAGLSTAAHGSALSRLKVLCDRLALLDQASSTMH